MSARIVNQYIFDAYCPECQWYEEGFDDEDDCQAEVDAHNREEHATEPTVSQTRNRNADITDATLITRPSDDLPRVDVIYRQGPVLGIIYGIPAVAPVRPRLPDDAEPMIYLLVPANA